MTSQRELAALVAEYRAKMGIQVEAGPVTRERAALLERDLPVVRRMVASAESLPGGRVRGELLGLARGLEERWTAELERGVRTSDDIAHVGYDNSENAFSWQRRRGKLEYS